MLHKTCNHCGAERPTEDFYRNRRMPDGRSNRCRDCCKREDRERQQRPERLAKQRTYSATSFMRDPDKYRGYKRAWSQRNRDKRRAHHAVLSALRAGRLVALPCEVCGLAKAAAHHDDYARPLDVRWLCVFHHAEHHRRERGLRNAP